MFIYLLFHFFSFLFKTLNSKFFYQYHFLGIEILTTASTLWILRFVWEFVEKETINCANTTVSKFFNTSNPDPGYVVQLWVYDQDGEAAYLEKNIKIFDAIEPPIEVSYPNMTRLNAPTEFVVVPHKGHGVT